MLRCILAALLVVLTSVRVSAAAEATYADLVARLKSGDTAVDYRTLRDLYAESPDYQPYGDGRDGAKRTLREAFNAGDCTKVLATADQVLAAIYTDIQAHLLSARCLETAGDGAKANFHRAVAKGLMDSIVASGDGRSTKTAFVVVTIDEEYDVLTALRFRSLGQALIDDDGHAFDRMDVQSTTSDEKAVLYFQIDRPMKWLSKGLGQE